MVALWKGLLVVTGQSECGLSLRQACKVSFIALWQIFYQRNNDTGFFTTTLAIFICTLNWTILQQLVGAVLSFDKIWCFTSICDDFLITMRQQDIALNREGRHARIDIAVVGGGGSDFARFKSSIAAVQPLVCNQDGNNAAIQCTVYTVQCKIHCSVQSLPSAMGVKKCAPSYNSESRLMCYVTNLGVTIWWCAICAL